MCGWGSGAHTWSGTHNNKHPGTCLQGQGGGLPTKCSAHGGGYAGARVGRVPPTRAARCGTYGGGPVHPGPPGGVVGAGVLVPHGGAGQFGGCNSHGNATRGWGTRGAPLPWRRPTRMPTWLAPQAAKPCLAHLAKVPTQGCFIGRMPPPFATTIIALFAPLLREGHLLWGASLWVRQRAKQSGKNEVSCNGSCYLSGS